MIGQIVNYRYEVLEKIGDGEMFSAYRARDKVLNRLVALKVLNKELAAQQDFAAALCAGYQDAVRLAHGCIARVFDTECGPENCYVATEYARGINVKERIRRAGPIAVPLALDIIVPVMEALEYAHANRIVHGDIRSQDIIVSPDGEVKLTDFGLCPALTAYPAIADKYKMRSVHYQAPEVVEGGVPTGVSDIYSAGVVLYEMVTGSLPFDGATAVAVALKKVKDAPTPPRSINTAVTKSLNEVIMRALERDPENRYQSAAMMLADLRSIRDAMRVGQAPQITGTVIAARPAPETEEMQETGERSLRSQFLLLFLVFVVVVAVALPLTMYVSNRRGEIRVPPLLGKTWDEANAAIKDTGIQLEDDGQAYSDNYAVGQICSMVPPPGFMVTHANATVKVKISKGPSQVSVPDITGKTETDANREASRVGFVIGKVTDQYSDKVPVNSVISQEPPGGSKREPGSAIDVVMSRGPKPEATPEEGGASGQNERNLKISVSVPASADGPQDVKIVVTDDNGENTPYEQLHDPGDKFEVPIVATGASPEIKVYIGDKLVDDEIKPLGR